MKNIQLALLSALLLSLLSCSCKSQPNTIATGVDTSGIGTENIRKLIPDSVNVNTLTSDDRDVLIRRYANDPSIISYRVIQNPFPQADSLTVFRKLLCNMSASRSFIAERMSIKIDYSLNRPDLLWDGNLVNTGVVSDRKDFNTIWLRAKPDTNLVGGYRFFYGKLKVSNTEAYELETFPPYSYFVLIHYNPSKLPLAACNGVSAPSTP